MKQISIVPSLERMNVKVFFGGLFLLQVLIIFQGFDLSDEGFFVTFYQQIFRHPETVQYNFMFWLSGIIGGAWNYFFGALGLWGMRLASVFVATGTAILTYNLLKKHINQGVLKLGLILVILFINNNAKAIQYNNLSLLFYLMGISLLYKGIQDNKAGHFFLCGILVALNVFIRLPNVLGLGLIAIILYSGFLNNLAFVKQVRQSLLLIAGFVAGMAIVFLSMKLLGHLDIFINAVKVVYKMGQGGKDSNYGIMKLVSDSYHPYVNGLRYTLMVIVLFFIPSALEMAFSFRYPKIKIVALLFRCVILAGLIMSLYKQKELPLVALSLVTGISLIAGVLLLFSKVDKDLKLLTFTGGFLLIVYPFGSSAGLYIVGIYAVWIILPIALDYLYNLNFIHNQLAVSYKNSESTFTLPFARPYLRQVTNWLMIFTFFTCAFYTWYYPFFDKHSRLKMTYAINNPRLKGIYTTKERAEKMNELLAASNNYMKKDDYVLAFDCIPMFHYLTETKPYVRNSFPLQYVDDLFKNELELAVTTTHQLPVVVLQTIKTTGSGSDWPQTPLYRDAEWFTRNKVRDDYMTDFLTRYHYQQVWTNEVFEIFVPANATVTP